MVRKRFEGNEFHMILRSSSRRKSITFLPEEIIFNILILLPAHLLHDVMRYVCRAWHTMIQDPRFVTTHSTLSPNTVLMEIYEKTSSGRLSCYNPLDVTECDVKLSDFKFQLPSGVHFMSSCNGLILTRFQKRYYVQNPITRRRLLLPEFESHMRICTCHASVTLAFEATSKVYKVVAKFRDRRSGSDGHTILTVGVDKAWRPLLSTQRNYLEEHTTTVKIPVPGFIYYDSSCDTSYIYGLDLKSETAKSITLPCACGRNGKNLLPKGNCISLWYHNPDFSKEVWVLKDYETEEWVKILYIEGEPIRNEWENMWSRNKLIAIPKPHMFVKPQSWLGNDEKIFFSMAYLCLYVLNDGSPMNPSQCNGHYISYDLNTHACTEVNMKYEDLGRIVPFINTLLWV